MVPRWRSKEWEGCAALTHRHPAAWGVRRAGSAGAAPSAQKRNTQGGGGVPRPGEQGGGGRRGGGERGTVGPATRVEYWTMCLACVWVGVYVLFWGAWANDSNGWGRSDRIGSTAVMGPLRRRKKEKGWGGWQRRAVVGVCVRRGPRQRCAKTRATAVPRGGPCRSQGMGGPARAERKGGGWRKGGGVFSSFFQSWQGERGQQC